MRYAATCFFFLVFSLHISAQSISPQTFDNLRWRLIGPFRGGRSVAVSGIPGGGSTFYFGGVDGGVWKTDDAGNVWSPIFDGQPVASIGALEVSAANPQIIYAGSGESDIRSNLASGDGVYKSIDAGKTWRNAGLKDSRQISRVVVHPRDPNIVFVAALGHAYAPNEERGIFRSTNGGETWEKVLYKGPSAGAADLAIATDAPEILFAALWEAHRPPFSTYAPLAGPGSGLYRSSDGGKTWDQVKGGGFPATQLGRIGVAIAPGTRGRRIYAVVEAQPDSAGVYRSDDGGDSWVRVNSDPRLTGRGWYFCSITVDPNDPTVVYLPNVALYKLSDSGKTLSIVRGAPGGDDYHQLWIDPANSLHMGLATDQGTSISLNGGLTWSTWYNQPTAQFYHVTTDNAFPYHVYGAQQDSSTAATATRSDYGQIDARDRFSFGASESGYVAIDPHDPNIIYSSGTYGSIDRFDRRTGQSQNIAPSPLPAFGSAIESRKYRAPWTPVLLFSPSEPNALFFGTQYVMKTLDGGLHWQTISPDLTGEKNGVIYSIAPSPLLKAEIWAGTDTGRIHLTRDAGLHWSNVTPTIEPWSKVTHLEASHFDPAVAYAAVDRHRLDDMGPYLYRTRDYGKSWQLMVTGIASHSFLNCIREDPKRRGLLYAATEFGVYVSFDDGDNWQSLQLNLPITSVRDLVIHDDDLVAATHGRSSWILDDIAPLRQFNEKVSTAAIHLFKPARAIRITNDVFSGTPLPPDEPQAKNPASGAYIDYYLAARAEHVVISILDAQGKVIRRFSSDEKLPPVPTNLPIAPRWLAAPPKLSTESGMHRWVWDLRFGRGADSLAGGDDDDVPPAPGPLVLPGIYKVRLSVDGHNFVEPVTVVMDPRSRATAAELATQFQWSLRVYADLLEANKAAAAVTAHPASQPALQTAFPALARSLNGLLNAIESADRTPPSQVIAAYREVSQTLKLRLADLKH